MDIKIELNFPQMDWQIFWSAKQPMSLADKVSNAPKASVKAGMACGTEAVWCRQPYTP